MLRLTTIIKDCEITRRNLLAYKFHQCKMNVPRFEWSCVVVAKQQDKVMHGLDTFAHIWRANLNGDVSNSLMKCAFFYILFFKSTHLLKPHFELHDVYFPRDSWTTVHFSPCRNPLDTPHDIVLHLEPH